MKKHIKVKKTLENDIQQNVIRWKYRIFDEDWVEIEAIHTVSKYKYKISNRKEFMKKFTDRRLNKDIKKDLSLLEKEILFDVLDYIDVDNCINFKMLAEDYWYSPSKISKAKSKLEERWLIRKKWTLYFLCPIIWIKEKEISQELIELFEDVFEKYNVDITF